MTDDQLTAAGRAWQKHMADGDHAGALAAMRAALAGRSEPTEAMELAGMRALRNTYRTVTGAPSREQARACWDAMHLAARA